MPTVYTGVRGTEVLFDESRRARDVAPSLAMLEPDEGPLTTLMMKLSVKKTTDPEFEWYEDELNPRFDTLNASLTAGAATMTVSNYKYFRKGDLWKVTTTGEIVRVTTTPTSSSVSITRAFGETAAAASNGSSDQLMFVGSAFSEGDTRRAIVTTQRTQKINYAQIFKTTFGVTETEKETKQLAGQDWDEERAKKMLEHKRDLESALWHSELKKDTTTDSHPIRATRGVIRYIQTNVVDAGGDLTEAEFEGWLRRCFRYGTRQKIVFCSSIVLTVLNSFARSSLITKSDESTYGVTMTQYQNAGRKVMLVEVPQFENASLADLTGIAGYAVCLDMGDLKLRHMRASPVLYKENVQANDSDSREDQILSELGLQLQQERKHGLLTGVTG